MPALGGRVLSREVTDKHLTCLGGGGCEGAAEAGGCERAQARAGAEFLRGCRDRALDENGRHLNGVLLVRRADPSFDLIIMLWSFSENHKFNIGKIENST